MRPLLVLAAMVIAGNAMAADAPKPSLTPTQEIFVAYELLCVKPGGKLAKAQPAIANLEKAGTIKPVPAAEAEKRFKKGDQVWATKTSTTPMFIAYDPAGICALHIEQADAKALKAQFVQYTGNVTKGMKGVLMKQADDKPQDGSLFSYYIVTKPGAKKGAGFGLSTSAPAAKKSPQHLLTFTIAKPQ